MNQVTVIQNGPVKVIEEVFEKKTVITFEIQSTEVSMKTIEIQNGKIEYTLNETKSKSRILSRIVNANLSNGVDFTREEMERFKWNSIRMTLKDNVYSFTIKHKKD